MANRFAPVATGAGQDHGPGAREGSTTARAEAYANEALAPLTSKLIASRVKASAVRVDLDRIEMTVTIYRAPLPDVQLRYQVLWSEIQDQH